MPENSERYHAAIEKFDAANGEDPNLENVDGKDVPAALIYGHRMSARQEIYEPDASEELQLACRAQHLQRWVIPRSDYPEGIKGYNQWRRAMAVFHAEKAGEIMREVGYEEPTIERVQTILRKEGRLNDPEVQALEDIACLVFVEHYFVAFGDKFNYDDDKLVDIVKKTLRKMSPKAHASAGGISLPERHTQVIGRAVSE